jgi:hypothetical protein
LITIPKSLAAKLNQRLALKYKVHLLETLPPAKPKVVQLKN